MDFLAALQKVPCGKSNILEIDFHGKLFIFGSSKFIKLSKTKNKNVFNWFLLKFFHKNKKKFEKQRHRNIECAHSVCLNELYIFEIGLTKI